MKKWSNEQPTEDGYYWYLEVKYEDGKLLDLVKDDLNFTNGPHIVHVEVLDVDKKEYTDKGLLPPILELSFIGDDCGATIYKMIDERLSARELPFMFDSEETKKAKLEDLVYKKTENWFMKIQDPNIEDLLKDMQVLEDMSKDLELDE